MKGLYQIIVADIQTLQELLLYHAIHLSPILMTWYNIKSSMNK